MSARQQNNVNYALVGKEVARTAAASIGALADGEIALFTPGGTLIDNTNVAADMDFVVAMGGPSSKPKFVSEVIDGSLLTKSSQVNVVIGAAETLESQYIGYNGTSGSIEAIDNNLYMVQVYMEEYLRSSTDGRYIKHFQYESDSSATQAEIAVGLAGSGVFNFNREAKNSSGDAPIVFTAVCNSAVTAANDFVNNITVVKGSKVVNVATAVTWGAGATTLAAGDFVRMGSNGAGTALTDDVYKVTDVDTTNLTFTVDRPISITGQILTAASSDAEVIAAATGAAANWGVSAAATTKDHVVGKEHYGITRFNLNAKDFGSTTMPAKTAGVLGTGDARAVQDHEWFSAGNQGEYFRMGEPTIYPFTSNVDKVTPLVYTATNIVWEDSHTVGFQGNVSPKSITLYSPTDASATTDATYMNDDTDGLWTNLEVITGLTANSLDLD